MFVQAILFPAILGGIFIMLVQVKLVQAYFEMILVCLSISSQFWRFFFPLSFETEVLSDLKEWMNLVYINYIFGLIAKLHLEIDHISLLCCRASSLNDF